MLAALTRMITTLIQALRCKPSALSAMECCWQDPRSCPENMPALTLTCKNRACMQAVHVAIKKIAQWAHTYNQYLCMRARQRHMYSAVHAGCMHAARARIQGQADQRSASSKLRSSPAIFTKITPFACRTVFESPIVSDRRTVSDKHCRLLTLLGYILCGFAYF